MLIIFECSCNCDKVSGPRHRHPIVRGLSNGHSSHSTGVSCYVGTATCVQYLGDSVSECARRELDALFPAVRAIFPRSFAVTRVHCVGKHHGTSACCDVLLLPVDRVVRQRVRVPVDVPSETGKHQCSLVRMSYHISIRKTGERKTECSDAYKGGQHAQCKSV